ncbi:hypothetical protein C8046_06250 [Serinibacter arcticus]|uniref:Uncharacterized protein n=1 Tax=Serinibacter arcticus TaxID=1655435 RepID=A0A2U1ZTK1_9MICO|nr:hypothetical protein [Serinibacter arcticus]PWD50315.1 hypothetical protein C8046_06250 [Serinibacter arcticus]
MLADPSTGVVVVSAPHVRVSAPDALDLRSPLELVDQPGEWFYLGRDDHDADAGTPGRAYVAFVPADAP